LTATDVYIHEFVSDDDDDDDVCIVLLLLVSSLNYLSYITYFLAYFFFLSFQSTYHSFQLQLRWARQDFCNLMGLPSHRRAHVSKAITSHTLIYPVLIIIINVKIIVILSQKNATGALCIINELIWTHSS